MASANEIEIVISGRNNAGRTINAIREALNDLNSETKKSSKGFGILDVAIGGFIANAASAIAGTLIGAITAIPSAIMSVSGDIQASNRKIQQSFGITAEEADKVQENVKEIWREGFADMDTATDAVIAVRHNFRDLADNELANVAKSLIVVSDVFGEDVTASANAAGTLMRQFGLNSEQSLDFLAAGFQKGLNASGDFIDSIGEYSNIFADAGFTADEFFSIIQTGLQGGVLGSDKVADAIKEFHIRLQDGSDDTRDALGSLYLAMEDQTAVDAIREGILNASEAMVAAKDDMERLTAEIKDQKDEAKGLEDALKGARHHLKFLSEIETSEVAAFSNEIERLGLRMKEMKLQGLGLEKGTDAYDAHRDALEGISTEIERLNLQRDLEIARQDAILEGMIEGSSQAMTFAQKLQEIAAQKNHISGLETELYAVQEAIRGNKAELEKTNLVFQQQKDILDELEIQFNGMTIGATQLLEGVRDGTISTADAFPQIIEMLRKVDDQILQTEIGVGLFGTQWEDMTANGILQIDQFAYRLDDFSGNMEDMVATGVTTEQTLTAAWRAILEALAPIGDEVRSLMATALVPLAQEVAPELAKWLKENLPQAILFLRETLAPLIATAIPALIKFFGQDTPTAAGAASKAFQSLGSWIRDIKRAVDFLKPVIDFLKASLKTIIEVVDLVIGAIVNLVAVTSGKISFGQGLSNMKKDLQDVVGQSVKAPTLIGNGTKAVGGAKTNSIAKSGTLLPALPKLTNLPKIAPIKGGGKLQAKALASGGDFIGGKPILVGERGPELLLPAGNGTVVPNNKLSLGMGNIALTINVQGDVEGEKTLQRIEGILNRSINKLLTQGNL